MLNASCYISQLTFFFNAVIGDDRLRSSHISLYMALFHCWYLNGCRHPVAINRKQLMVLAKISGLATYHKCIRQLKEYGYIEYLPSFHPGCTSRVWLVFRQDQVINVGKS